MKQPNHHVLPIWQKLLALACMWLATALAVQAQGTGTIQGRVFNPVTQSYIRNAEVKLTGSTQTTYTENDGSFTFANVPAGPATVTVQFTGYNTATENFTVTAGQTAVREINMTSAVAAPTAGKDGVVQLQAFTVASEREGNSKAIQAQRRDMNIINSVSSDLFGDVADGNVGEFLKYLPGVDLDYVESEARGPRLGGMDGQYVGVAFDGMRTASADANRGGGASSRATSFEGFSISSIESIEINLTSSPENDGDTPAGNINMRTKRAFDRKGRQVTYNFSANMNSEEFTLSKTDGPRDKKDRKWRPNYILSYSESFFNQRLGILLSANHSYSYTEQIANTMTYTGAANTAGDAANPAQWKVRTIDFGDGPKFIQKDAILFTADWRATPKLVLSLNAVYSYFEGEFWNRTFSFNAANDNTNVNNGRQRIRGDGMTTIIVDPATANNVTALNVGGGGAAKLVYTRQFAPRFEYKSGGLVVDGAMAFSRSVNNYESNERGFSKDEGGSVASGFTATRPNAQSWEWTIRQTSGADWFDLKSFTGGTRITNDDRTWTTEKWTGTLNGRYVVPFMRKIPTVVKVGGKWDEESRKNHDVGQWSVWSYNGPGGNTTVYNANTQTYSVATQGNWANLGPQFISANPFEMGKTNSWNNGGITNINGVLGRPPRPSRNAMSELFTAHPEMFQNIASVDNYYNSFIVNEKNLRQTITAGYAQADTRVTSKLMVRWGVRAEETKTEVTEFDPLSAKQMYENSPYRSLFTATPGTVNGRPTTIYSPSRPQNLAAMFYQYTSQPRTTREGKYLDWFPSINLKYNVLPNMEWQAGWNKSIGRPSLDSIAGLWTVDENAKLVTAPNPTLEPERHNKYLTRLIYYFQGKSPGSLSLTASKTNYKNTIAQVTVNANDAGNTDPDFSDYDFRTNFNITDKITTTKNLGLAYRQTLGFLPSEYLRGITIFANYDRTYVTQSGDGSGAAARRAGGQTGGIAPHRVSGGVSYRLRKFNASTNVIWSDDRPEGSYSQWYGASTKFDGTLGYNFSNRVQLFVQARNITNVKDGYYKSPPGVQEGKQAVLRKMEEYGSNWVFGVKGTY